MRLSSAQPAGTPRLAIRSTFAGARSLRALALVLAGLASFVAPLAASRDVAARGALDAVTPSHGAIVWVTPPDASAPAPSRIAFLHGMCMDPQRTCERVRSLAAPRGALACPTGNGACGGGADWTGDGEDKAAHLDAALAAAWSHVHAEGEGPDVLVGFSRGAFVARDVAYARPGRYRALVLLGAAMIPDAARLRASGVRRVVLASGDFDPARRTMERAATELTARGVPARFVSLGPIGHALPKDPNALLGEHLAWALSS